jgi:chromate transport protein ChrA
LAVSDDRHILAIVQAARSTLYRRQVMTRMFWPAVAVAVIALFFLIAGIGPLLLDIVLLLLAVVVAVRSRTSRQKSGT